LQGYESTTVPPSQLQIGGNSHAQLEIGIWSTKNKNAESSVGTLNVPAQALYPSSQAMYPVPTPFYHPFYGHMPFPSYNSPATLHRILQPHETPSSGSAEDIDDPTLFPCVTEWLHKLECRPHGADGHKFHQYGTILEENMFIRISHLENLTKDELIAICASIPMGTASLIQECACK
jgi:hypothetical protein